MPGQEVARRTPIRGHRDHAGRREDAFAVPFRDQHLVHRAQHLLRRFAREHQRTPRDPQAHTQRGLVRAVSADVADDRVHGAVGQADRVVEVAAEQHPLPTWLVADLELQVRVLQQRGREQAAFEPGPFRGKQFRLAQLELGVLGAAAFDRVPDAAQQQLTVDLALDQIVLGTRGDRLDAFTFVVPSGQHEDSGRGRPAEQAVQAVEALRVGQTEVEQDALGVAELRLRLHERAGTRENERRTLPLRAVPRRGGRRHRRPRPGGRARSWFASDRTLTLISCGVPLRPTRMSGVLIRVARPAELPYLQEIEIASGEPFREVGMPEIADDDPMSLEDLAEHQVWVAVGADDVPVAFIAVGDVDDATHIHQVSVHPAHARQGIGAALIEHIDANRARGDVDDIPKRFVERAVLRAARLPGRDRDVTGPGRDHARGSLTGTRSRDQGRDGPSPSAGTILRRRKGC